MRTFLLTLVSLISVPYAFAQNNAKRVNIGQGDISNSVFQNSCDTFSAEATNTSVLWIESKGKQISKKGNSLNGIFRIDPEKDQVYDCSFKKYVADIDKKMSFTYRYYNLSNEVSIRIDGEDYVLSTIDGGCDMFIDGVNFSFHKRDKGEILVLTFEKDVTLHSKKGQELTIKKGSYSIFIV